MATDNIVPNGDLVAAWTPTNAPGNYTEIDEAIGSPNTADYVSASGPSVLTDRYLLSSPGTMSDLHRCTAVRVGLHAKKAHDLAFDITVRLLDNGNNPVVADKTIRPVTGAYSTIYTASWAVDFTWDDILNLRLEFANSATSYQFWVATAVVEVTYELLPPADLANINIGDVWKEGTEVKINIGDSWKEVTEMKVNIGDVWKTIF